MVGWRKMSAFLGLVVLAIVCVVTGRGLGDGIKDVLMAGIGMLGVGNYLEHKMRAEKV